VSLRRVATFATTTLVAIVVALAVPVSQLQMVSVIHHCCCPDPDDCHCPKTKSDHSTHQTMGTCHGANELIVAPQAPSFTASVVAIADRPQAVAAAPSLPVLAPHDPPPPTRPDAPS
jgi:hypothetical protein